MIGQVPDTIAVPTHFFKVLLVQKKDSSFAIAGFILPNRAIAANKSLKDFVTPVEVIEKYSGLLFFEHIKEHRKADLCSEMSCSLAKSFRRAIANKLPE